MTDGGPHTYLRYTPALATFPPGEDALISQLVADLRRAEAEAEILCF